LLHFPLQVLGSAGDAWVVAYNNVIGLIHANLLPPLIMPALPAALAALPTAGAGLCC
jgi:hypothetical protein